MKLLLLIRSLNVGGAERQFFELAQSLKDLGVVLEVATFYSGGLFEQELIRVGVNVTCFDKRSRYDILFLFRFLKWAKKNNFTHIYSFMDAANFVAGLCKPFIPNVKIVWGIRSSNMDLKAYGLFEQLFFYLIKFLSIKIDGMIFNSYAGLNHAKLSGFFIKNYAVVFNGIDSSKYVFSEAGRNEVRKRLGFDDSMVVIGTIARFDPIKGHEFLLGALKDIFYENKNIRALWVGHGPLESELKFRVLHLGLGDRLCFYQASGNLSSLYSAMDLHVLPSLSEGFPNVLAESQLCGIITLSTRVGDSVTVIGREGYTCSSGNAEDLKSLLKKNIASVNRPPVIELREKIINEFPIQKMVYDTLKFLKNLN